ncbi:hypothetical protein PF005_g10928 [Phytophthora fragariae]|uniref:SET domain-containing protein n=1 Tax=Phytophthora fragariae TaxID=53985 RepID=A0A6A3F4E5_9STRA|nr:hypothetical protein PF003_g28926 [Phytophthora fragariae]KAE8939251.1 hypothetical protein PF009_g10904 [Phytophthora fragariae]KAE9010689.1 hypothetical protein PF011_g9717 [Phytophthora fragariae]KAE9111229.1 hypothetical protein PF010_g10892 [Phytophthora fragariae]KAE9113089.1 hypothetical protein PF007_g10854 [Phytophthora fragariae]
MSKFAETVSQTTTQSNDSAPPVKVFEETLWPARVAYLHANFNPKSIKLPFVYHFGDCECGDPCKLESCRNARMDIFCTDKCCIREELCANRPRESANIKVMREEKSGQYALVAIAPVKRGDVLGEYLGQLRCVETDPAKRSRNQGFLLQMRVRTAGVRERCVGIDALHLGGRMRFANHSCVANAEFYEVANGRRHTIVVVSTENILPGKEVTVNYGKDLWFVCGCKHTKCVHRNIQDQEDP